MWNFLAGENRVMFTRDLDHPDKVVMANNPAFMALKATQDALLPTPVFRAGLWLALCVLLCALGWRRRGSAAGAFALGVCGSAVIYVMSFLIVGVASDYRYAYWAVLAAIAGTVVLLARAPQDTAAV
jgi:peptidoglycan/LPS O-acetylase OafA/YrhL